jgi:hypothetical protein
VLYIIAFIALIALDTIAHSYRLASSRQRAWWTKPDIVLSAQQDEHLTHPAAVHPLPASTSALQFLKPPKIKHPQCGPTAQTATSTILLPHKPQFPEFQSQFERQSQYHFHILL